MKPYTFGVLKQLAGGQFLSGQEMARSLGMSRGSVWHAVQALEAGGLEIYKVRGRGYRLAQPLSLLDPARIARHLGRDAPFFDLEVIERTDSTNTLLVQRAAGGAPHGTVIAAEWQEHGRGRMGRTWHAGPCGAVTFSLLWRFTQGAGALAGLSLAAGVALIRALKALGVADAGLKWPNDVIWHKRKLAGLLIEMHGDTLGPSAAVIGIGLNVRLSEALQARIDQPAADLESACGGPVDRSMLLARLLIELRRTLEAFGEHGFAPFRNEWQRSHAYQDKPVRIMLPGGRREQGRAAGVAEDGALLIETAAGTRRYHSGEISLRARAVRNA
jgi:BirA family biotin operon repressor/biotin-[acetyl-CoA-carboxylase] ligase